MNILIIKNDGIGDLVLTSGIISYLGKNVAKNIDLLTCFTNRDIANKIENINEIFYVSRDSIKEYSILNQNRIKIPFRFANDKCKIVRFSLKEQDVLYKINQKNYDLVIVLRRYIRQSSLHLLNSIKSKNKLCMWEIPTNLSFEKAKELSRGSIHLSTYNLNNYIRSELEYYEAILSKYFNRKIFANPKLNITKYTIKQNNKVALIISGGSIKISVENWTKLCRIINDLGFGILLLGAKDDSQIAKKISAQNHRIDNKVGIYSFDDYAKVFSEVSFVIGNDTGLTHFASLIHKKVLVLLGGGTFGAFFPWRDKEPQEVYYHYLECYNCIWRCTNSIPYKCLTDIFDNINLLKKSISDFLK